MKKLYAVLTLILLLSTTSVFAQDFAPVGAKWVYSKFDNSFPEIYNTPLEINSVGDTLLLGKSCRHLIAEHSCMLGEDLYLHQDGDTVFYFDRYDSVFHPLYVFNAQVGDIFYFYYHQDFFTGLYYYTIDSTWTEIINGDTLRTQQISWEIFTSGIEGVSIVNERLGNMEYLFNYMYEAGYTFDCINQQPMGLRCYSDPYFGSYETGIVTDCYDTIPYVSVEEINTENGIKLWPNPANNALNIQLTSTISTLSIYNINGQLVKQINVSQMQHQIITLDVSDLPKGIYSLVGIVNWQISHMKFVKQ